MNAWIKKKLVVRGNPKVLVFKMGSYNQAMGPKDARDLAQFLIQEADRIEGQIRT